MATFLIHGWAATDKIWPECLVSTHSYPYYYSGYPDSNHLETTFWQYTERLQKPVTVIGWSLGGMLALQLAANHPKKIKQLILISSTARFTTTDDYHAGLAPGIAYFSAAEPQS